MLYDYLFVSLLWPYSRYTRLSYLIKTDDHCVFHFLVVGMYAYFNVMIYIFWTCYGLFWYFQRVWYIIPSCNFISVDIWFHFSAISMWGGGFVAIWTLAVLGYKHKVLGELRSNYPSTHSYTWPLLTSTKSIKLKWLKQSSGLNPKHQMMLQTTPGTLLLWLRDSPAIRRRACSCKEKPKRQRYGVLAYCSK